MEWAPIAIAIVAWVLGLVSAFAYAKTKTAPAKAPDARYPLPPAPLSPNEITNEVDDKILNLRGGVLDRERIDKLTARANKRRAERGVGAMRD